MPFVEDRGVITRKNFVRNISFEKSLPRQMHASEKKRHAHNSSSAGMAAKMAEEEAKREADEILRPKVDMDRSYASQGHIPKQRGAVSFDLQHNRRTR